MTGLLIARTALGAYLMALVALAVGDLASFARLGAVCLALGVEAMARLPEAQGEQS